MSDIKVLVIHPTDGSRREAVLPDDVPIRRLLPALITKMKLPVTDPGGRPTTYRIDHKGSGTTLSDNDTLASAGIANDDELRLRAEWTAGGMDA